MVRGPRMTKNQKIYLVNYLEKNKDLVFYNSGIKPEMDKEIKWRNLARALNSPNLGPGKTTFQWKDTFKDFRTSIRRKSKILQMKSNSDIKVSNAELKFMKLMNLYTPSGRSIRYEEPKEQGEEEEPYVKLEGVTFETVNTNDLLSDDEDDDPLVRNTTEENENEMNDVEHEQLEKSTRNNKMTQKEFIQWQRNKIKERLSFTSNASIAVEIENHALQIQKLASSFDKHADALASLAKSFDRISSSIDNVAYKLVEYFQK